MHSAFRRRRSQCLVQRRRITNIAYDIQLVRLPHFRDRDAQALRLRGHIAANQCRIVLIGLAVELPNLFQLVGHFLFHRLPFGLCLLLCRAFLLPRLCFQFLLAFRLGGRFLLCRFRQRYPVRLEAGNLAQWGSQLFIGRNQRYPFILRYLNIPALLQGLGILGGDTGRSLGRRLCQTGLVQCLCIQIQMVFIAHHLIHYFAKGYRITLRQLGLLCRLVDFRLHLRRCFGSCFTRHRPCFAGVTQYLDRTGGEFSKAFQPTDNSRKSCTIN